MISLKNVANMRKMLPLKYFPVFARVRIQAPHVFTQKLIPQEFFPACIGFVPGGTERIVFLVGLRPLGKPHVRGRQLVDGMGGGWNGCFWGAPILHLFGGKMLYFPGFRPKIGAPQERPFLPPPIPSPS